MPNDEPIDDDEKQFCIERAKTGRAACKKCKEKCETKELRIAKLSPSPFGSGKMKNWYHIDCIFLVFNNQRPGTVVIESSDDIDGWDQLDEEDRDTVQEKIYEFMKTNKNSSKAGGAASTSTKKDASVQLGKHYKSDSKDNLFREFRRICADITNESSYLKKSAVLNKYLLKGSNNSHFEGNLQLWIHFLLPTAAKRVYNLQSKQLVKLFSRVFHTNHQAMQTDLEKGDVGETISTFFDEAKKTKPCSKSTITMTEVDVFLESLSKITTEDEQVRHFEKFCVKCTSNDLKMVIRMIKHDLRINAGPKHILEAVHHDAYKMYQSCRDLSQVVAKYIDDIEDIGASQKGTSSTQKKTSTNSIQLMCPVSPMLAEACKSVEKAIQKCPQGMYSEIKYDGERVQLHKDGDEYKFFSRNLKPVLDHKISRCNEFIPQAFPKARNLILDSEIILIDTRTNELLPFGSLSVHKKHKFESAEVCLFVFDCIYYNDQDLTKLPLQKRRKFLEENIVPIQHHVQLSEYNFIKNSSDLSNMIATVLKKGLEGLVLKNVDGIYEPGKRHWLKVKKDYLFDGKMADTADLVVLGSWFGTGKKGGMYSIFLMGCHDTKSKIWKTVTKVHTGLDDAELDKYQGLLSPLMIRSDPDNIPKWLNCKKSMMPDMIAKDPFDMPVWEITGAEFSKADIHTASGISIRFPRITKIRDDKSPEQATTLDELLVLFQNSKDCVNIDMLLDTKPEEAIDIPNEKEKEKVENKAKNSLLSYFKKEPVKKKAEDSKSMTPIKKIKKEDAIYDGIKLYVVDEARPEILTELEKFLSAGGEEVVDSRLCTHTLHKNSYVSEDMNDLRKKFDPLCRHVQYQWLTDCVKNHKIENIINYPVFLRNPDTVRTRAASSASAKISSQS